MQISKSLQQELYNTLANTDETVFDGTAHQHTSKRLQVLNDYLAAKNANPDITLSQWMQTNGVGKDSFFTGVPDDLSLNGRSSTTDVKKAVSVLKRATYKRRLKMMEAKLTIVNTFIVQANTSQSFGEFLQKLGITQKQYSAGLPADLQGEAIYGQNYNAIMPFANSLHDYYAQTTLDYINEMPDDISSKGIFAEKNSPIPDDELQGIKSKYFNAAARAVGGAHGGSIGVAAHMMAPAIHNNVAAPKVVSGSGGGIGFIQGPAGGGGVGGSGSGSGIGIGVRRSGGGGGISSVSSVKQTTNQTAPAIDTVAPNTPIGQMIQNNIYQTPPIVPYIPPPIPFSPYGGGGGAGGGGGYGDDSGYGDGGCDVNPNTGNCIDPNTGYDIDPNTGYLIDPNTGYDIDPNTGLLIDPNTGQDIQPQQPQQPSPAAPAAAPAVLDDYIPEDITTEADSFDYSAPNYYGADAYWHNFSIKGVSVKKIVKDLGNDVKKVGTDIGKAATSIKKAAKKVSLKGIVHDLNKFNPAMVGLREAVKGVLDINIFGLSTDIGKERDGNTNSWNKILNVWSTIGGTDKNFGKVIDTGKNKKKFGADGGYYNDDGAGTANKSDSSNKGDKAAIVGSTAAIAATISAAAPEAAPYATGAAGVISSMASLLPDSTPSKIPAGGKNPTCAGLDDKTCQALQDNNASTPATTNKPISKTPVINNTILYIAAGGVAFILVVGLLSKKTIIVKGK